jgi:hypothetical protein
MDRTGFIEKREGRRRETRKNVKASIYNVSSSRIGKGQGI